MTLLWRTSSPASWVPSSCSVGILIQSHAWKVPVPRKDPTPELYSQPAMIVMCLGFMTLKAVLLPQIMQQLRLRKAWPQETGL